MQNFSDTSSLQTYLAKVNKKIVLVPTMGGLHAGHLSLVDIAKKTNCVVVVSIFVNPAQFGENEDLKNYPQNLNQDLLLLQDKKVDVVFTPNTATMYPSDFVFNYDIGYLSTILCALARPVHFKGVTKAVYRLFDIIKPHIAIFGKKDYQQLMIIKKMVVDLNLAVNIIAGDIIRDSFGLALSTRNLYLNSVELTQARKINLIIQSIINYNDLDDGLYNIKKQLQKLFNLDYCVILDADNLNIVKPQTTMYIILVAVKINTARLIDNFIFDK